MDKTLFKTHEIRRIFIGGFHPENVLFYRNFRELRLLLVALLLPPFRVYGLAVILLPN
jgi:hypothetical protein